MNAVIVGAGASGLLHALALRAAGVQIEAIYDPDHIRAEALADACGARTVTSVAAAASTDASIAAICSPPNVHVEQAEALTATGRVVFVEKPVAVSRAGLDRLRQLPRCVPIVQWRAGRALRALRRAIAAGDLGAAPIVSCELSWPRDDAYFRARSTWACGVVLSIGIHALDAIGWALGRPIERTAALAMSRSVDLERETGAAAVLRFAGGAMASFAISVDGGGPEVTRITISGSRTTVRLEGGEADPTGGVLGWHAENRRERERLEALEASTAGALGMPLLVPYLGAAVAAIRDGEEPGASERLPSIDETFHAHAAAMMIAEAMPSQAYGLPLATATRADGPRGVPSDGGAVNVIAVSETGEFASASSAGRA